jgi:hypothetical protein
MTKGLAKPKFEELRGKMGMRVIQEVKRTDLGASRGSVGFIRLESDLQDQCKLSVAGVYGL